jgi:CubicO group peptidase (beta-lactamase class C family)
VAAELLQETTPAEAGFRPGQIDRIRERASEWIETDHTRSLVLLAARGGKIGLHEAWGAQSFDDPSPLSSASIFPVSSISKVITAAATMRLVEDGALSLNRLVREYVPELQGEYTERILMHQLLTHTSGFADVRMPPVFMAPDDTDKPCPEGMHPLMHRILQTIYSMDCYRKPGEECTYSNENFVLLGHIIERVSGQSLNDFARAEIFDPLGMQNTTYLSADDLSAPFCRRDPAGFPFDPRIMNELAVGAGSVKSNAMDLAVFCQAFLNGGSYNDYQLLHPWTVSEMTRNQIPGVPSYTPMNLRINDGSWGLGWMVQGDARWPWSHGMLQPRSTFYHQGATGAGMWVDPVHDIVGIYLSIIDRDMTQDNPMWEFDKFQNMVTTAVDYQQ